MTRKEIELQILRKAEKKISDHGRYCERRHSLHPAFINGLEWAEMLIADLRKKLKGK